MCNGDHRIPKASVLVCASTQEEEKKKRESESEEAKWECRHTKKYFSIRDVLICIQTMHILCYCCFWDSHQHAGIAVAAAADVAVVISMGFINRQSSINDST